MSGAAYTAEVMPARRGATAASRPGAGGALGIAALCLLALVLVWLLAELVPAARTKDALALREITSLRGPHLGAAAKFLLDMLNPLLLVFWGAALALIALGRGRPRLALAVALVIGLAPVSADQLKPLLA